MEAKTQLSTGTKSAMRWLILALVIVGIAIGFSGVLATAWHDLKDRTVPLSSNFVLAWLIFGMAVFVSGLLWGRLLSDLQQRRVPALAAGAAHCVAWLLKYIPGQVSALVYKIAWGRTRRISPGNVTLSFVYENIFLQMASFVPGLVILAFYASFEDFGGDSRRTILVAGAAALGIMLIAVLLGPTLRFGFARIGRSRGIQSELPGLLNFAASLRYAVWFVMPRVLNGAGFVLVAAAITPVTPGDWALLGAIYVVAGAIGILAVFVPSGLGVREGVIVVLASPIIGASAAIFAAILARLIATAADALVALVAAFVLWKRPSEISSTQRDAV